MSHTKIDEAEFDRVHGELPPIYFNAIDGNPVDGVACSEPAMHTHGGIVVFNVVYGLHGAYYSAMAKLRTPSGEWVMNEYDHEWGKGYKAFSH